MLEELRKSLHLRSFWIPITTLFIQIFTLSYQCLQVRRKLSLSKSAESPPKRIDFTRVNDQVSVVVEEKASNVDVSTEWRSFQNELVDVAESQVHTDDAGYPASSNDRLNIRIKKNWKQENKKTAPLKKSLDKFVSF